MIAEQVHEDLSSLIHSPYRGPLLLELRDGTTNRTELRTAVEASRATISRALEAFEEREWVARTGQEYRLTTLGRLVADEFAAMVTTLETAIDLRGIIEHVPIEDLGFDIGDLRDATVIRPTEADPLAATRHANRFVEHAASVTMLSRAFLPGILEAIADQAPEGQTIEIITVPSVIEAIAADTSLSDQVRAFLEYDSVSVLEYTGEIPHILAIADGTVSMGIQDGSGRVLGVIDSENEAVQAWAKSTVAEYRERADPVGIERLD